MKFFLLSIVLSLSLQAKFLQQDKVKHVAAGMLIYLGCIYLTPLDEKECLIPVGVAAVGKEIYDNSSGGTSDFNDITATLVFPLITYTVISW